MFYASAWHGTAQSLLWIVLRQDEQFLSLDTLPHPCHSQHICLLIKLGGRKIFLLGKEGFADLGIYRTARLACSRALWFFLSLFSSKNDRKVGVTVA